MKTPLRDCTLAILGDSYSTFAGEMPEGCHVFYPHDGIDDVLSVEDTWWRQLIERRHMRLLINDSSSGTTVSTSVRKHHSLEDAFVMRMQKSLSSPGIHGEKPDCILLFGGTNDSWLDVPPGTPQYEGWTDESLRRILPAYCYMLDYTLKNNPDAAVYAIVNTDMKAEVTHGIQDVCAHYSVPVIMLHDISKQYGHPNRLGMRQIADQVDAALV